MPKHARNKQKDDFTIDYQIYPDLVKIKDRYFIKNVIRKVITFGPESYSEPFINGKEVLPRDLPFIKKLLKDLK